MIKRLVLLHPSGLRRIVGVGKTPFPPVLTDSAGNSAQLEKELDVCVVYKPVPSAGGTPLLPDVAVP